MSQNENSLPPAGFELVEKFAAGQAKVGVIGLGYVGLPLAVLLAEAGYQVVGVDTDEKKVAAVNRGESHVLDVSHETLKAVVEAGNLSASTSYEDLSDADGICISVPTPLRKTGDPDLSYILDAARKLAPILHPPIVVILESTTYPGTTRGGRASGAGAIRTDGGRRSLSGVLARASGSGPRGLDDQKHS